MKRMLAAFLLSLATLHAGSIDRIAFGSCNRQDKPQPLWKAISEFQPQLWIWLGDNIYGSGRPLDQLEQLWNQQKNQPDYAAFRAQTQITGIWDDHDYGANDGGKTHALKKGSQKLFLDFLEVPGEDPRWHQEGIYGTEVFGEPGRQVRVILLDIRTHRDRPRSNGDILGDAQWQWLEKVLSESTADLHLICSGTQILPAEHRFEKWSDYPASRARLLEMLQGRNGVILLSGDRHFAEVSKLEEPRLLEITTSGMTHSYSSLKNEPNALREGEVFKELNFATLEIDWVGRVATASIRDVNGTAVRSVPWKF